MTPHVTSPFGRKREQVEGMLRAGEPLASVEQAIAEAPLPEDEQAALWLVAWSLGERPVWRRSVRAQFTSPARA